jgi:hypothetical protein
MLKALIFVLVWMPVILPFTANAQQMDAQAFQAFSASSVYQHILSNAFAAMPPALFKRCPTLVSNGSTIKILQPVTAGANGFPNGGLWKQSFPVSGCGNDTILNLYFTFSANGKMTTIIGLPGNTLSDLTLQRDALGFAKVTARALARGCASFIPINTFFLGYGLSDPPTPDPGPDSGLRPWHENWTLVGCGNKIREIIDFIPDQTGTGIVVPLADAVEQ